MTDKENVQVVSEAYAAFVRGDIPAILNMLAPEIDWHVPGPAEAPYAGRRRTRHDVGRFFSEVARTVEFSAFEPQEFIAQEDRVIALGHYEGRVRATGKTFSAEWAMTWRLRDGKAVAFREYTDTQSLGAAFR
jgi:ketosteroid isomerase-like protein